MLIRKRWKVRQEGRWEWGSVVVAVLMSWVASRSSSLSVHWPGGREIVIPEWMSLNITNGLDRSYEGDWRRLPFKKLCRLPYRVVTSLMAGEDDKDRLHEWMRTVMTDFCDQIVLLITSGADMKAVLTGATP